MKISIITPTYNSSKTLQDSLESIGQQNYQDLEHLIIDGLSKDDTVRIAKEYQEKFPYIKIISEKDSGIYDAMNKGVNLATGEIVGILNSDDFYYSNDVLSKVNKIFEADSSIDAIYGDIIYIDQDNKEKQTRYWKSGEYSEKKLNSGWIIPHPSLFIRKRVYDSLDKIFDTRLRLAADYELILRLLKIKKIKVHYLPEVLVKMRDGGASGANLKQRMRGWKELRQSWVINDFEVPKFFILRRVAGKLGQFILRLKK